MAFKDYYRILGIKPDSGFKEIKDAYRRNASDFHPDKHPEKEHDPCAFHEICEAYEVLGRPQSRREYDREYAREYKENQRETYGRTSYDEESGSMGHSRFGQMFDDLFEQLFFGSQVNIRKNRKSGGNMDNIHYDDLTSGRSD